MKKKTSTENKTGECGAEARLMRGMAAARDPRC